RQCRRGFVGCAPFRQSTAPYVDVVQNPAKRVRDVLSGTASSLVQLREERFKPLADLFDDAEVTHASRRLQTVGETKRLVHVGAGGVGLLQLAEVNAEAVEVFPVLGQESGQQPLAKVAHS